MKVHHCAPTVPRLPGAAAALGTFDGVHLGHQAVLDAAVEESASRGVSSAVVTFDGHPADVLRPESAPVLITSMGERLELFAEHGFEHVVLLPFDEEMSRRSADDFVSDELAGRLGIGLLVAGTDLHFGHRRRGNVQFLEDLGARRGFELLVVPDVHEEPGATEPVSSTSIRRALRGGDVAHAARMLGRWFSLRGEVVHGDHRGRTIGFPTANIELDDRHARPADGVYAGWCEVEEGVVHPCAVNIGRRPTFHQHADHSLLEAHLLGFSGDLYGATCRVSFVEFVRSERRFGGIDELVEQLNADVVTASDLLGAAPPFGGGH